MSLELLDQGLNAVTAQLHAEGRAKAPERIIVDYIPPQGTLGPRYKLAGSDLEFIRMNSNSYLSLSHHPQVIAAADAATHRFGAGPGAVRFIDGTFDAHVGSSGKPLSSNLQHKEGRRQGCEVVKPFRRTVA